MTWIPLARTAALAGSALALAGCASLSADGGLREASDLTRGRTGQALVLQAGPEPSAAVRARVAERLQAPLSAEAAVEVALLRNRDLQARLASLGIAEADWVSASRPRNPGFSIGRSSGGGVVEIDRSVMFDLLGLLTLPVVREVEGQRLAQARIQAAQDAVALAADTRRAYYSAVAAQELQRYYEQVQETADIASELAGRMAQVGNVSRLAQMREQVFQAETKARRVKARQQALAERERLTRLLGLAREEAAYRLPDRLPDLPAQPTLSQASLRALPLAASTEAEQAAMDQRLDILLARRQAEATARSLGLTRSTRLLNVLEAGVQDHRSSAGDRSRGYEVRLELPLFDFGSARVARAEATYRQALHGAAAAGLRAQSEVRESHAAYLAAYELARHYRDEVVPLRKRISEENLLRYNGMLLSVFELLADAREQMAGVSGAVEALRDFWIAQVQLESAITGSSPGAASSPSASSAAAPSAAASPSGAGGH